MILKQGWWKTPDGRLVPDGHPDAAVLAYPRWTEIPDATAQQLGIPADAAVPAQEEAEHVLDVDQAVMLRAAVDALETAQAEAEVLRAELDAVRQQLAERDAELAEAKAAARPADKGRAKPADKGRA